jgi:ribosomal protein L32
LSFTPENCYNYQDLVIVKNELTGVCTLGKPKKRTTPRRTGTRRSHLVVKLARSVNAKSPVHAYTTRRESGKVKAEATSK